MTSATLAATAGGPAFDPAEFATLAAVEACHFWFRVRRRILCDAIARWFSEAESYLEFGCGTGFVGLRIAALYPGLRVTLTDPEPAALRLAGRNAPPNVVLRQIEIITEETAGPADIVAAFDVLEHLDHDRAAIACLHRACRPGGGLLLTVPQHRWLWSESDVRARHRRRYSAQGLTALLQDQGFQLLARTSFNTLPLPLLFCRSLSPRAARASYGGVPPWPANAALEAAMELERRAIRCGLRLPFGGSLLVAARRPA